MRNKRSGGCKIAALILFLGGFCALFATGILLWGFPIMAVELGPASPSLDPVQRNLLAGYLIIHLNALDTPVGDSSMVYELEVAQGATAVQVASQLHSMGLLPNGALLTNYLRYRGLDTGIDAGQYILDGGMTIREIAAILQKAQAKVFSFTIVEGWRREQIVEALRKSDYETIADAFLLRTQQWSQQDPQPGALPFDATMEGYLFPDTYSLPPDLTADDLVNAMLDNFLQRFNDDLRNGIQQQGLTLHQAVTLASIVEREAILPEERPIIGSVFFNRLTLGMKLEADPTVQYALGQQPDGSWWKAPLSLLDLDFDSPYNTYLQAGIPPGPIANPGLASLHAIAFPEDTPYLYFRAKCDGSGGHAFAVTFEEHEANACE